MNAPARESRLNKLHLIVTIVTSLLAAALGVFSAVKQNQAQELTVNVEGLNDDLEQVQAERDAYSQSVEALEAELAEAGEDPGGAETAATGTFLALGDAVDTAPCTDGYHSGEWNAEGIEIRGEQYWNGFSCIPYHSVEDAFPVGHAEFRVPDGIERVTGTAGFDDRSADSTMIAEFLVHSVPEGEAPLFSQVLAFGETAQLDVDLTGVQRVRFEVQVRATDYIGSGSLENTATLAWADMKFE